MTGLAYGKNPERRLGCYINPAVQWESLQGVICATDGRQGAVVPGPPAKADVLPGLHSGTDGGVTGEPISRCITGLSYRVSGRPPCISPNAMRLIPKGVRGTGVTSKWVSEPGINPDQNLDSLLAPPCAVHYCDSRGVQPPPPALPWVRHVCPV